MPSETPHARDFRYVMAVLVMAGLTTLGVVGILALTPDEKAGTYIALLLAALAPTTLALLAYMKSQETHLNVNSRLDEMMRHAKEASRAEGRIEGRDEGTGQTLPAPVAIAAPKALVKDAAKVADGAKSVAERLADPKAPK